MAAQTEVQPVARERPAETRSIAEVIMQGDGRYETQFRVNDLGDGTFLVYEKQRLFGLWEGFARVRRVADPSSDVYLPRASCCYQRGQSDEQIIRKLNDLFLPNIQR